jgi:hypothetical protein
MPTTSTRSKLTTEENTTPKSQLHNTPTQSRHLSTSLTVSPKSHTQKVRANPIGREREREREYEQIRRSINNGKTSDYRRYEK